MWTPSSDSNSLNQCCCRCYFFSAAPQTLPRALVPAVVFNVLTAQKIFSTRNLYMKWRSSGATAASFGHNTWQKCHIVLKHTSATAYALADYILHPPPHGPPARTLHRCYWWVSDCILRSYFIMWKSAKRNNKAPGTHVRRLVNSSPWRPQCTRGTRLQYI